MAIAFHARNSSRQCVVLLYKATWLAWHGLGVALMSHLLCMRLVRVAAMHLEIHTRWIRVVTQPRIRPFACILAGPRKEFLNADLLLPCV